MADFKTHLATSSVVGVACGVVAHTEWHIPEPTCVVAAGLCGLAGMLPDMDSDTGNAQREIMSFTAAITPMLLLDRFASMGLTTEKIVIATACVYIIVRFGLGEILRRYTVHRGMFHSIPAAAIAGLIAALVCACDVVEYKFIKVGAVVLGYLIHLVLDELWSFEAKRGRFRVKRSFGTALKFFGNRWFPNVVTYGLLLCVATLTYQDPNIMRYIEQRTGVGDHYAEEAPLEHDHDHAANFGLRGEAAIGTSYP